MADTQQDADRETTHSVLTGADGVSRCRWVGSDPEYQRYHDEEWGHQLHGDQALFEKLSLEAFQAGLSWITILRRRPGFRAAFDGFDPQLVASYGDEDIERLMGDERIIRNRAKVLATIGNARLAHELSTAAPGALDELMWSFAPPAREARPTSMAEIPAITPESTAMSTELQRRGFKFVGPTTMYALMQSSGMVDDHVTGCWRAA
ncbi:DNA-3-methyladenine glycosylase I [Salinibacterium sp. G-O1]|uniref:DNA-3-methyladenine glycosylase I n=1 Tax=Salinibacterium sp. G-O1 TaxID=3046208 RepID=UPI0024B988CB|nr:DNA-3-methyladenine glycosylase I [Salinibacterium sp. G-O1]MDJ0334688.1 DNA-3-methyladenine glycosylase I [Salinibacterium sp. G-O1]